ncbi:Uncharacterised protein (plasmid) [Tsukamurella tyrosinosolvens]|uniref:Uncharacterized protein n=1 Tax=Tsukamurella tyrosinosolvens TaxID=57704 RepID=A0A1H4QPR8_TSUTY|nr:hypothetical protein SAMN04489793_1811 [Tsukamurella tyrosinosolvens]VEH92530.1 Uncharacterised protein [Tsukamurella tyrosinosolvens]
MTDSCTCKRDEQELAEREHHRVSGELSKLFELTSPSALRSFRDRVDGYLDKDVIRGRLLEAVNWEGWQE